MNVYRDVDGKPEFIGQCDLVSPSGRMPRKIAGPPRVQYPVDVDCKGPMGTVRMVRDEWETCHVQEHDGINYGIKLRATDNPEHLPGWKPIAPAVPTSEQYPRQVIHDGSVWHVEPEVCPTYGGELVCGEDISRGLTEEERRNLNRYRWLTGWLAWSPIRYEAGVVKEPLSISKRSVREMARSAAKAFAQHFPPDPLSFGRDKFVDYMADVIEALMGAAARGEYRPVSLDPNGAPDIFDQMRRGLEAMPAERKAAIYRAAGLDPDGEPAGLPKRDEPEERPFVPNKFGEHGDD